jgi:hypothetical protein
VDESEAAAASFSAGPRAPGADMLRCARINLRPHRARCRLKPQSIAIFFHLLNEQCRDRVDRCMRRLFFRVRGRVILGSSSTISQGVSKNNRDFEKSRICPENSSGIHRVLVLIRTCAHPCTLRAEGKPVVRRGRKAQGLLLCIREAAWLPNRGRGSLGNFPRGKEGERMRLRSYSTR